MTRAPWEVGADMFLAEAEVAGLLEHVRSQCRAADDRFAAELDRLIVECLLFSGLRTSEFCRLRWADGPVALGMPALRARGEKKEERLVHLPAPVDALLRRFDAEVRPRFLPDGADPRDPEAALIFNEHRRPFERTGLYRRVVRVLTAAGLGERASIQLLRHTYGYLAYKRTGGNLLFVQRQLGHAHPLITAVYARFADENYAELADRVAGAEGAPRRSPARSGGKRK